MRLIDADELIEYIKILEIGTSISSDQKEFIDCINRQPTAFDVDKIVKELDEKSIMVATSREFYNNPKNGEYVENVVELRKAIEIVKGGGVE